MKQFLITLLLLSITFIAGCAKYAPANMLAQSRVLQPEKGHSLTYVIRPKSNGGNLLKLPLAFEYNGNKIGTLWAGQFLYFNARPMQMVFNGKNGEVIKLNMKADKTYFLEYLATGGIGTSFSGNKPLPITRIMSEKNGRALINQYRLTGKFQPITITQSSIKAMPVATKQPARQQAKIIQTYKQTSSEDSMSYNNKEKSGHVTIATGSKKKQRRKAIRMIEELCSTKNISLKVGTTPKNHGATYTTMDESLSNGQLTIHFACSY